MDIVKMDDELGQDKSPFMRKMKNFAEDVLNDEFNPLDFDKTKGFIICAIHDTDDKRGLQTVTVGMGTEQMMMEAATAMINHPMLGPLLTVVLTKKMLKDRFGS